MFGLIGLVVERKKLKIFMNYEDYIAESLEKNISYSEYISENLNLQSAYCDYLCENLNKNIRYSDYLKDGKVESRKKKIKNLFN